jgi:hypothetical protein
VTDDDSEFDLSSMAHEDRLVLACLADASGSLSRSEVADRVALESIDKDGAKYRLEKYIDRGFIDQWNPDEHHVGLQHELQGRGRRLGQACLEYTDYETPSELTRAELLESIHELSATVVDLEQQLDQEVAALQDEVEALREDVPASETVESNSGRLDEVDEKVKPELADHLQLIMLLTFKQHRQAKRHLNRSLGGTEFESWLRGYEKHDIGWNLEEQYHHWSDGENPLLGEYDPLL